MKPLLFLHGAIGSSAQMNGLKDLLANDFGTFSISFPGHGERTAEEIDFSIAGFANDVIRVLDEKKLESVDVFGYSMGGYVALYLARHFPDRIGRLMTLATKFSWSPESAAAETKLLDPDKLELKVPAFATALKEIHGQNHWKNVLLKTAGMMTDMGRTNPLTPDDFRNISCPVLLAVGDQDKMVSREETEQVLGFIKNSSFAFLENTPHPLEKVDLNLLKKVATGFFLPD